MDSDKEPFGSTAITF